MRVIPGETEDVNLVSFLSLNEDQTGPNWPELVVGQNHHLDLPWPCYFRLPQFQMVESDNPCQKLTTWVPLGETDDGFPEWRAIYYTPVVRWPTDTNGRLVRKVLYQVTVDLLVVTEPMKERWDRAIKQFPPAEHDYRVRSNGRSVMADISPMWDNLLRKMGNPPETRREEAQAIEILADLAPATYVTWRGSSHLFKEPPMGTDYYSYLYVAAEVQESDIIETVSVVVTVCDHPHNNKFCPDCGTKATERTRTEERKQYTKPFAHLTKRLGQDQEPSLYYLLVEWDGDVSIDGLRLFRIATSNIDDDGPLYIGRRISDVGGWRGDAQSYISPATIITTADQVREAIKKAGLGEKNPTLIHTLYASV